MQQQQQQQQQQRQQQQQQQNRLPALTGWQILPGRRAVGSSEPTATSPLATLDSSKEPTSVKKCAITSRVGRSTQQQQQQQQQRQQQQRERERQQQQQQQNRLPAPTGLQIFQGPSAQASPRPPRK